ncbi:hypothetical protein V1478_018344 [Vespula squamosa]|uniref:Uncharacterized protein n=1 Tax=Vespula squamosa TaxID=30214 RepID=A0ABD1ZUR7_VESSQ
MAESFAGASTQSTNSYTRREQYYSRCYRAPSKPESYRDYYVYGNCSVAYAEIQTQDGGELHYRQIVCHKSVYPLCLLHELFSLLLPPITREEEEEEKEKEKEKEEEEREEEKRKENSTISQAYSNILTRKLIKRETLTSR